MQWEYEFLTWIQGAQSPVLNKIMAFLSHLGDHGFFWIALGLVLLIFAKTRPTGIQVMLSIILTYIIGNMILKNLVDRPRPYDMYAALQPLIPKLSDFSFPSGHTMNGFTAAVSIFLNHRKAGTAALILAALIAISRLYNLVHYPTDILGGLAVGIGCALLANQILKKWRQGRFRYD